MHNYKKTISPVVATALLIVVTVVAAVGFQQWYQSYESTLFADTEQKSSISNGLIDIEYISQDGIIYITNKGNLNVSVENIKVDDSYCSINEILEPGVTSIDINFCLNSNEISDIVIITESDIVEEEVFVGNVILPGTGSGPVSFDSNFTSVWDTSLGSGTNDITLPLEITGSYNFIVNWGDGNTDTVIGTSGLPINHTYAIGGIYEINISGQIVGWRFNQNGDNFKIIEIKNWGPLRVGNNGNYFHGCGNLDITATDSLDLTGTTNLINAFNGMSSLSNPDFSGWDVSSVTNMYGMFQYSEIFNGNITNWDVSNVRNMSYMFSHSELFNQDISGWNVSKVVDMKYMFYCSDTNSNFNQDISGWNVSSVTNMFGMFQGGDIFNQDLSGWDVDQVTSCTDVYLSTPLWVLPKPNFTSCTP